MTRKEFQPPTDEEIARYAYYLWESEGRIHGRDLDYWLQAKAHLTAAREYESGLLSDAAASPVVVPETPRPSRKRQRQVREPVFA